MDSSLTLINASKIVIQPDSTLVLWINTLLNAGGTSKLNVDVLVTGAPPNMLIKGISMTELNLSKIHGRIALFTPRVLMRIDNTSELWGSVYAGSISLNGGKLHCDMALSESKATYGGY